MALLLKADQFVQDVVIAMKMYTLYSLSIIAKRLDCTYMSGERTGMEKIKRNRTADCVIGGFRYASKAKVIGSLLLGLYDTDGLLHHVGFCSGLKQEDRKTLRPKL